MFSLACTTVDCERNFFLMNLVKTDIRNLMKNKVLNELLIIHKNRIIKLE